MKKTLVALSTSLMLALTACTVYAKDLPSTSLSITQDLSDLDATAVSTIQKAPAAPVIKKLSIYKTVNIKLKFKKSKKVSGYEIESSATSDFSNPVTVTSKANVSAALVPVAASGAKNYVRFRSYKETANGTEYSPWSKTKKIKAPKAATIYNTNAFAAIEADVSMKGSGSGYHAKLLLQTPTSAVSFGIQYHKDSTNYGYSIIENVKSNAPGQQQYLYPDSKPLKLGSTYHMMITMDKKGNGSVYIDYEKVGSFSNPLLCKGGLAVSVEGSARLNGDGINAKFSNIRFVRDGVPSLSSEWLAYDRDTCKTIRSIVGKNGTISVKGIVTGLSPQGDWDSEYDRVSGVRTFSSWEKA